ncbi:MAG: hypothetical protein ACYTKD_01065 [Planctomycetota bacterium]|jgi:hypothetical protein
MLPIKKVVLYKHGVGYFEREGEVDGDAAVEFQFKSDEMNDVLKSLTVLDLGGGIVSSISYESTEPVERQLEDIAIRVPDGNAWTGLLSQVKGARVEATVGPDTVTGTVAGIETVTRQVDSATLQTFRLALLVDGESLVTFDMLEIRSLRFLDENLKTDLSHLLEILIASKKKDAKKLTLFAKGEGARTLLASYVVETPVWKTSYRVILPDDDAKRPLLQGWAIVDNTQDEDWSNVALTLVAGLPVSFIHDLYSPRHKRRPVVEVQEEEAYAPPVLEESLGAELEDMEDDFAADMMSKKAMAAPAAPMKRAKRMLSREEARASSAPVQTRTAEAGDLFQYQIENPVTVRRNQSALVPILQSEFDGKRVGIYNPEVREKNPMSAILFKNTTGLTLEGGPLTAMEGETYVGESMLDTMKPDEERLVPYSVELGCTVTIDHKSETRPVHTVQVVDGYMRMRSHEIARRIYLIRNKTDRKLDLFLDHRFNPGWDLLETPEPHEKTESFYRFRIDVPAKGSAEFVVAERHTDTESCSLSNLDADTVRYWVSSRYIDEATEAVFMELVDMSATIEGFRSGIEDAKRELEENQENQERLRENLQALSDTQQERRLRERYVSELEKQEDRIAALGEQVKAWREKMSELEKARKKKIRGIAFKKDL